MLLLYAPSRVEERSGPWSCRGSFGALAISWRASSPLPLAHQDRTIAIASNFRVDGAKSPEIPQKEGVSASEIATRNRKSLATFRRTLKSQCKVSDRNR